ncbi:MAG: alanine racemase [Actinobacteria bacterium]|nr:alanine racemase [Actinomycetota bacterium]
MEFNSPQNQPTVARISEAAIRQNFLLFRNHCGPSVKICPAVKANAYGHGVSIVAPVLAKAGADMFCVANTLEAQELETVSQGVDILVFTPIQAGLPEKALLTEAVEAGYHLTIADMSGAEALVETASKSTAKALVHIKVDTGMGRMGTMPQCALELVKFVSSQNGLQLQGLYTHFASADEEDPAFTLEQLRCFNQFLQAATKIVKDIPLIHAANSAAALRFAESRFNMVRPGLSIYGYQPSRALGDLEAVGKLRPTLRLESRLVLVKDLPEGHSCGYGRTFRASRKTKIGIVPIGYSDGYDRAYSNRAVMSVAGGTAPVIGRVSMDQTILDLTDLPQAQRGDVVTVISEKRHEPNSVEALAELVNTIPYEVTCRLGRRITRQSVSDF